MNTTKILNSSGYYSYHMHSELLMNLGLSLNEARIYESLIDLGEASVNTISIKTKINRSNVYDTMERLCEKGLTSELFVKNQKNYKATHPKKLLEILKEKEEEVEAILPELTKKFEFDKEEEQGFFHRGIEAYRNYMLDILKQKKTYYCIGGKGMWFDPRLKYFRMKFDRERKKSKILFHHIFDEGMEKKITEPLKFERSEFKFLPKKYCSKMSVEFFGDTTVVYSGEEFGKLKEEPTVFVIKSKDITEGFKKIYSFIWDHC